MFGKRTKLITKFGRTTKFSGELILTDILDLKH